MSFDVNDNQIIVYILQIQLGSKHYFPRDLFLLMIANKMSLP